MTVGVAKAALLAAREALDELIANDVVLSRIDEASRLLIRTLETNGRVFSCGNGGSMCDAMGARSGCGSLHLLLRGAVC